MNADAVKTPQSHSTDDIARWTIKPLPLPTIFPYLKYCDDKINWAYNMPIFLVYLGFKSSLAFMKCKKLVRNPGILQSFFDANPDKNPENLDLLDLI